jgi:hypothetical protein
MREYSEDNFGARALNWIVIVGAAILFVLVSFSSLAPVKTPDASQLTSNAASAHVDHA